MGVSKLPGCRNDNRNSRPQAEETQRGSETPRPPPPPQCTPNIAEAIENTARKYPEPISAELPPGDIASKPRLKEHNPPSPLRCRRARGLRQARPAPGGSCSRIPRHTHLNICIHLHPELQRRPSPHPHLRSAVEENKTNIFTEPAETCSNLNFTRRCDFDAPGGAAGAGRSG